MPRSSRSAPIPPGMTIDHMCHNDTGCPPGKECPHRKCVNPRHLRAITLQENVAASHNSNGRKTHCPGGHEYLPENTRVTIKPNGVVGRSCLTCERLRRIPNPRQRKEVDPALVVELHGRGVRATAMARQLGVDSRRINAVFDEMGLPRFRPGRPCNHVESESN